MVLPGLAESDVSNADGAPSEESGQTGDGKEPVKDNGTGSVQADVGDEAEQDEGNDGRQGTARLVNVGEELGSIALLSESSQGSGSTVNTRHTDGQDGHENDEVHEVVEALEASILADKHKGRGLGVGVGGRREQSGIIAIDQDSDEEETEDVEDGDTPEDLLNSTGHVLGGVVRLSSGETNQLGTGEGEGGSDEDGAEALEAVLECTGVVPVTSTPVFVVATAAGAATADEDKSDDHEDDGCRELEARCPKLLFGVTKSTKQVDDDDGDEEDGDPYGSRDVGIPIRNRNTTDGQLKRKNGSPLKNIVPAHGETPGRIDETSRVCVERTRDGIHDGEFTESIHDVEHHDTDDEEINEERTRALQFSIALAKPNTLESARNGAVKRTYTSAESTTRTDEETSTNGTTNGNHVQMASLHGTLKLHHAFAIVLLLEGVGIETVAGEPVGVALGALLGVDHGAGLVVDDIVALLRRSDDAGFLGHDGCVSLCLCLSVRQLDLRMKKRKEKKKRQKMEGQSALLNEDGRPFGNRDTD